MEIIERVFSILREKKLKSKDLASFLGVNPSVLSTWKARQTPPPTEYILRICDFIGISEHYLLTGNPDKISTAATPGTTQLSNAAAEMTEADRLLLAGAILQEIRQHGRFDAAAFLGAPAAVPAPMGSPASTSHAPQPINTIPMPDAKNGRQQIAGDHEGMIFVPVVARGRQIDGGGVWVTPEKYAEALEALKNMKPIDPARIKDL